MAELLTKRERKVIREVVSEGMRPVCWWLVAIWVMSLFLGIVVQPTDDTDESRLSRSNMVVRTDALTGCQYLHAAWGGLTPRLDENGRHICEQEGNE